MHRYLRRLSLSLGLGLLAATLVWPLRASADTSADKKRATALLQEGARLLDKKDFSAALERFIDAYRLVNSAKIQFNIGLAQEALDRPAQAIRAYRVYIEEATADSAARRQDARVRIDALRPHVTQLLITSEVPGAVVLVDGVEEGRTPLSQPLVINPGPHQVVVQFQSGGDGAWTKVVRGEPGARVELQVAPPAATQPLPALNQPLAGKTPEPVATEPRPSLVSTPDREAPSAEPRPLYTRGWFWGVVGGVVAAGVVGVVLATRGGGSTSYPCDFQTTCVNGKQ